MSITLAMGVPKAGKTLALQAMVREAVRAGHVCYVVNRCGDWDPDSERWSGDPPASAYPDELAGEFDLGDGGEEQLIDALHELRESGQGCMVLFNWPYEGIDVARLARRIGDVIFVDDELDLTAPLNGAWAPSEKDPEGHPLRDFTHRGRHLPNERGAVTDNHIWGASRRPQNLHTDLTQLVDEVLLFRLRGRKTWARVDAEGWLEETEQLAELRSLPNLHYFLWRSTGEVTRGVLNGY